MTKHILIAVLSCACGTPLDSSGGDPTQPDAGGGGGGDGGGGGGYAELIAGDWSLPAGSEGYYCVTRTLGQDTWITGFKNGAPAGTHHTALSVGAPIGPDGAAMCGATDNRDTIIYGAGVGTPELVMPAGLAVRVRGGQQLMLNLHLFNAGDQVLSGHSGVLVTTTDAAVDEAGIANMGRTSGLAVPPGASTQVGTCDVPVATRGFSVFPHMHGLGVHMRAIATTAAGPVTLIDRPYSFEMQRYYPIAPEVQLAAGDRIRVECSYVNSTGATVYFGQSSTQEMCGLGVYVTPPWPDPSCGF